MSEEIKLTIIPEDIEETESTESVIVNPQTQEPNNEITSLDEYDIISSQTGIDDRLLIERTYMECQNDTAKTIMKLLNILPEEIHKEPTDIDIFRNILDEKDKIYHDMMARNKRQ